MPFIALGAAAIGGLANYSSSRSARRSQERQSAEAANRAEFVPFGTNSSFSNTSYVNRQQAEGNAANMRAGGFQQVRAPDGRLGYYDSSGQFFDTNPSVYNQLTAPVKQGVDANLAVGNAALSQGMGRALEDPDQRVRERLDRYNSYAKPRQQQDFDKLLGGMALNGQLGQTNNNTGTNSQISSFAEGVDRADRAAFDVAEMREEQLTDMLLARGNRAFQGAGGVEALGRQDVDLTSGLGGRAVNSTGAQLLANSAQNSYLSTTRNNSALIGGLTGAVDNFTKTDAGRDLGSRLTGIFGGGGSGPAVPISNGDIPYI
jgi:hypothetical protein